MNIYLEKAIHDIHEFEHANYGRQRNVSELSFKRLLSEYLEWNGIIGYENYIIELIKYALPVSEEDLNK